MKTQLNHLFAGPITSRRLFAAGCVWRAAVMGIVGTAVSLIPANTALALGNAPPNPAGTGGVDLTFNPIVQPTFTSPLTPVEAIAVQPDGMLLVGGSFSNVSGVTCSNLVRLNPDGTVDPSFNLALTNFYVDTLAVLPDGNILAGGTSYAGIGQGKGMVRLQADGSLDTSFLASVDQAVNAAVLQPDGRVLIGGLWVAKTSSGHELLFVRNLRLG
jgi:uncharacterized delta-60 repeat protein